MLTLSGIPAWASAAVGGYMTNLARTSENRMLSSQADYTSQGYKLSITNKTYDYDGSSYEKGTSYYYNYVNEQYFNYSWDSIHPPLYP